jgi:hypothetical protein
MSKTTAPKKPATAEAKAAKRSNMIACMRDVSLSLEQANAELVRVKLAPMTEAEAAEYNAAVNAPLTVEDILGKPEAKPAPKVEQPKQAAPQPEAGEVPHHAKVAVLRKILDGVGPLLRVCAPAKVAEYKAMKAAGKRAEAYGFALTAIMQAVGE